MRVIERRWIVAVAAMALVSLLIGMVWLAEAERERTAAELFELTADDVAAATDSWFDEHLTWQRDVAFDLSSEEPPATPEDANRVLATAVGDSIAQFALWLDADGRVVATFPVRADMPAGTDLRGVFPHFDAVLDGDTTAMWATDQSATSSGRVVALVTRPSATGDLLSIAFDPADTPVDGLVAGAAGRFGGAGARIVEPVTGAALLDLAAGPAPTVTTRRPVVEGMAELTYEVPVRSVAAAIGGTQVVTGRIAVSVVTALLLLVVWALPRWARRVADERAEFARTDAVIDGSPVPTALLTEAGDVVRVNQAFVALFGWTAEGLAGQNLVDAVVAEGDREAAVALLEAPAAALAEIGFTTRTGRTGTGRLSLVRLDEHDTVVAQLEDLTELIATQEALADSRSELRLFAGRVAHDLNNPLTAASGLAEVLTRMDLPRDQQHELLGRIAKTTTSAMDLVRRLYATADRVGGEPWEEVSLPELADELTRLRAVTLAETRGSIDLDVDEPTVLAPAATLRTVLGNVIDNALKYRRDIPPRITITDASDDDMLHLVVRDNGTGVAEADLEHIFDEGATVHGEAAGHGSGLAECRRLVGRIGGRMWATTVDGSGLAVHMELPRAVETTPVADADRAVPSSG